MRFTDVLQLAGVEFRCGGGDEVRICCLRCDDGKFHLYANPKKGVFHCFRCGWSGSIRLLLKELRYITGRKDIPGCEDEIGEYIEESRRVGRTIACSLPAGYYRLTEHDPYRDKALEYLRKRGIGEDVVQQYDIGFCVSGRFAGRIIFPVRYRGKLVSYIGRDIFDRLPKVLTPFVHEADPPSRYFYNWDQAVFFPRLVITEGVFDCLTLRAIDAHTCAVASFGKHLTTAQIDLILGERFSEVIFAWDGDALEEALRFGKLLAPLVPVKIAIFPYGEDPNSLGREQAIEYIRGAVDLSSAEFSFLEGVLCRL